MENINNIIYIIEKVENELLTLEKHIPANRPLVIDVVRRILYKAKEYLLEQSHNTDYAKSLCDTCGNGCKQDDVCSCPEYQEKY